MNRDMRPAAQHLERQAVATGIDAAQHDGAERRDDDGAAQLPREVERAGRDAKLVRRDRVLHDRGGDRIHHAQSRAADREQHADLDQRQPARPPREHHERDNAEQKPADRHELVMGEPHH
jgi:hypothetical protein